MVNTATGTLGGPQASPVTPRGVNPQAGPDTANAQFATTLAGFLPSGQQIAARKRAKAEVASNTIAGQFTQQQLIVAEGVAQGKISSSEGRSRARANLSAAIANNPAQAEVLRKAHQGIMSSAGGGLVIKEGTEEEQQKLKMDNTARGAGWQGNTPEEQDLLTDSYFKFVRAEKTLASLQNPTSTASINNKKAAIELGNAQRKQKANQAMTEGAAAFQVKYASDVDKVVTSLNSGEISASDAQLQIKNAYVAIESAVNKAGMGAGTEYVSAVVDPMTRMKDNYLSYASGEMELSTLKNQNDLMLAKQKNALMVNDPELIKLMAVQEAFQNTDLLLSVRSGNKVLELFSDEKPNPLADKNSADTKTYYGHLKKSMDNLHNGTAVNGDVLNEQILEQVDGWMNSIVVHGPHVKDGSEMNDLMDFMSSNSFGQWAKDKGGIPSQHADMVKAIQSQKYEQVVIPLIRDEYKRAINMVRREATIPNIPGGRASLSDIGTFSNTTTTPTPGNELIKPVFSGSGLHFVPVDVGDPLLTARARDLNKDVSPVINRIIRFNAHIRGSMDYLGEFNSTYSTLFEEPQPVTEGSTQAPVTAPPVPEPSPATGTDAGGSEDIADLLQFMTDEEKALFNGS